jgi:hypothetical protein
LLRAAVRCTCGATGAAQAFDIDTGSDDLRARWDNTVRYNLGSRVEGQDAAILANANADDGDRNFDKGSLVTSRLDLLPEFDLVWQRKYGLRLSAASWYDHAYANLAAGWQLGRALLVALRKRAAGEAAEFMRRKITIARFHAEHLLTRVPGLRDSIVDGAGAVCALA